jgi:YHS domain-containing protein
MTMIRFALAALVLISVFGGAVAPAAAKDPVYTSFFNDLAVGGHDTVAYFTESKLVKGKADHSVKWNGASWRFSSAANLAAFKADPKKYAPQFGGYCAWAVSRGYTASSDPAAWKIVNGKLYLNYSLDVQRQWLRDVPGNIAKGDANWPKVLE